MATPILKLNDQVLMQAEQEMEGQLSPAVKQDYLKIVVAGMRAGLHGGPKSLLANLKNKSKDPINDAAVGALNLVMLLNRMAKGHMPMKAAMPAAFDLMLHALDFVDRTGLAKIGPDELDRATHIFTNHFAGIFHLSPAMLQHAMGVVHGIMQDPTKMDLLARRTGISKDPRASEPSGIIGEEGNNAVQS